MTVYVLVYSPVRAAHGLFAVEVLAGERLEKCDEVSERHPQKEHAAQTRPAAAAQVAIVVLHLLPQPQSVAVAVTVTVTFT
eukprot:183025-Prorocentrum_minimum.AAC.1